MQTRHFFQKKFFLLLSLFSFFFIIVPISSCDSDTKKLTGEENCFTITREAIKTNMLAGGWSVPGDNDFVPYIYFFPIVESMTINAIPSDKDNHLFSARRVTMDPPNMDPPCSFPKDLKYYSSQYDFYGEGFAEDGRLISFDFLRLIARASTEPGHETSMVFDVYTVTKNSDGTETVVHKGYSKPCPPYCPVAVD